MFTSGPRLDWSYTTLIRTLSHGGISRGVVHPDATLDVVGSDGVEHALQLLPVQIPGVMDAFAARGVFLEQFRLE